MAATSKPSPIAASLVRELRFRLRMNQSELAARLGTSQRTVSDWETKGLPPTSRAYEAVRALLDNTQPFVLAVAMAKGGTGKTTTAFHVGASLARHHGRRVLLVDLDPQGSLTKSVTAPAEIEGRKTMFDVLVGGEPPALLGDVVMPTRFDNLFLAPGGYNLYALNTRGIEDLELPFRLREQIVPSLGVDYVVIDTPPGIGQLMHSALIAADRLLIPVRDSLTDIDEVKGTVDTFRAVQKRMNPDLRLVGALLTQVSPRDTLALKFVREQMDAYFGEAKLGTEIALSTRFKELRAARTTIFEHDPRCRGAAEYQALVDEMLARWAQQIEPDLPQAVIEPPLSEDTLGDAGEPVAASA